MLQQALRLFQNVYDFYRMSKSQNTSLIHQEDLMFLSSFYLILQASKCGTRAHFDKFTFLQIRKRLCISYYCIYKSHYPERASALDFKDTTTRDFVIVMWFLSIFSNEHQNMLPVNHQQKC